MTRFNSSWASLSKEFDNLPSKHGSLTLFAECCMRSSPSGRKERGPHFLHALGKINLHPLVGILRELHQVIYRFSTRRLHRRVCVYCRREGHARKCHPPPHDKMAENRLMLLLCCFSPLGETALMSKPSRAWPAAPPSRPTPALIGCC